MAEQIKPDEAETAADADAPLEAEDLSAAELAALPLPSDTSATPAQDLGLSVPE